MDLRASIKNAGPMSRYWHLSDLGKDLRLEPAKRSKAGIAQAQLTYRDL